MCVNLQTKGDEVKALLKVHHIDIGNIIKVVSNNIQNWSMVEDIGDDLKLLLSHITNMKQLIGTNSHSLFETVLKKFGI